MSNPSDGLLRPTYLALNDSSEMNTAADGARRALCEAMTFFEGHYTAVERAERKRIVRKALIKAMADLECLQQQIQTFRTQSIRTEFSTDRAEGEVAQ